MQLGSGVAVILHPTGGPGQRHAGGPGKFDFYCSRGHRLAYYPFLRKIWCCLRNFCINSSLWNNYDSWFFNCLRNIHLRNFKFDSWITNHESLNQTLQPQAKGTKSTIKQKLFKDTFMITDPVTNKIPRK